MECNFLLNYLFLLIYYEVLVLVVPQLYTLVNL